jgi:hypothetical protein
MMLSKKQQKLWIILVTIASLALILTSMMPFVYSLFK